MKCQMGFDGECYHLYINDEWVESSVVFEDVKRTAEKAGFTVDVVLEAGHPLSQPVCRYASEAIIDDSCPNDNNCAYCETNGCPHLDKE